MPLEEQDDAPVDIGVARQIRMNDQIRMCLDTPQPLPPNAEKVLGEAAQDLARIAQNPEINELDYLTLTKAITRAQGVEYCIFLPDSKKAVRELEGVAQKAYQYLLPRIPALVDSMKKSGQNFLKPFLNFLESIRLVVHSQQLHTDDSTHRNYQFNRFIRNLNEKLTLVVFKQIRKQLGDAAAVRAKDLMLRLTDASKSHRFKQPFSGAVALDAFLAGKRAISGNEAASKEILDDLPKGSSEFGNEDFFAEIEDLSHLKKVEGTELETKNGRIVIANPGRYHAHHVAKITLCVDKRRIKTEGGMMKYPRDATMNFMLDRSTGEIVVMGTCQPASYILGQERYQNLKNLVYKKLLEGLTGADFSDEEERVEEGAEVEDVQDGVQNELAEALPKEAKPISKRRSKDDIRRENFHFGKLRGMKAGQILSALKKIRRFVEAKGSSHSQFINPEGVPITFPYKNGDGNVPMGILKAILRDLGVTPKEMYDAL